MRETCARVLAAALMTGAIASVVAMSALLNTPRDDGYALTTPPSSLQRSVRVPALAAPPRPVRAERLVTALSVQTPVARPVVVKPATTRGAVRSPRSNPKPVPTGPAAPEQPEPPTRELAATTPPPEVQPAAQAPSPQASTGSKPSKGKGKGKSKGSGKGKDKDQGSDAGQTAPAAAPVQAPPPPASDTAPQDQAEPAQDHGHGNGQGNGHGKGKPEN